MDLIVRKCNTAVFNTSIKRTTRFSRTVSRDISEQIEEIGIQHPGVTRIANSLMEYITNILPYDDVQLIDDILMKALSQWALYYDECGYKVAFTGYCSEVFRQLPRVFNYRVRGMSDKSQFMTTWDCTQQGIVEWVCEHRIKEITVEPRKIEFNLSHREKAFLISRHVFSRLEMSVFGVPTEGQLSLKDAS